MCEEMYEELYRYVAEYGWSFRVACELLNVKYLTGFTVAELRELFSKRYPDAARSLND